MKLIEFAESGLAPDWLVRMGIRQLLRRRVRYSESHTPDQRCDAVRQFAEQLRDSPLAIATDAANRQHYEVPDEFFRLVLGPHLKYSACLFEQPGSTLPQAEAAMLRLTCERAGIEDGMRVLELGCGWGSLTLWIAEHYPACQITAVSNSASQRRYIEAQALERGLHNLTVITADMRSFDALEQFDRIVSVEMFEHIRNYQELFKRVAGWLAQDGQAFVHIFCHRDLPYVFETDGPADWMGRHFFTGGTMPSEHLFEQFSDDLEVERQWRVNGQHYNQTCEAWLRSLDEHREQIQALFERDLGPREARLAVQRWRMFFMACAELFAYRGGEEWFVAHYVLKHADASVSQAESLCETANL